MKRYFSLPIMLVVCLLCAFSAQAQTSLMEIDDISLGEWIILDNDTVQFITVFTGGTYTHSPGAVMMQPPTPGRYQISGLPPFQTFSVTGLQIQPLQGGGAPPLTLDDFEFITPDSDGAGISVITMGVTARTTGDGTPVPAASMNGTIELTIVF